MRVVQTRRVAIVAAWWLHGGGIIWPDSGHTEAPFVAVPTKGASQEDNIKPRSQQRTSDLATNRYLLSLRRFRRLLGNGSRRRRAL